MPANSSDADDPFARVIRTLTARRPTATAQNRYCKSFAISLHIGARLANNSHLQIATGQGMAVRCRLEKNLYQVAMRRTHRGLVDADVPKPKGFGKSRTSDQAGAQPAWRVNAIQGSRLASLGIRRRIRRGPMTIEDGTMVPSQERQ